MLVLVILKNLMRLAGKSKLDTGGRRFPAAN